MTPTDQSAAEYDAAQPDPRKPKRKNKPGAGRPKEDRERLVIYVQKSTAKKIEGGVKGELDTPGKVVDAKFEK